MQNENVFGDSYILDPVESLVCIERLAWNLIDEEFFI